MEREREQHVLQALLEIEEPGKKRERSLPGQETCLLRSHRLLHKTEQHSRMCTRYRAKRSS